MSGTAGSIRKKAYLMGSKFMEKGCMNEIPRLDKRILTVDCFDDLEEEKA